MQTQLDFNNICTLYKNSRYGMDDTIIYEMIIQYILTPNDKYISLMTSLNKNHNDHLLIQMMDGLFSYLLNNITKCQNDNIGGISSINVIEILFDLISKMNITNRKKLTKFMWSFVGMRSMLKYFPLCETGNQYVNKSIFRTIKDPNNFVINIDELICCYSDLLYDNTNSLHLINYIVDIADKNIGYIYDDPSPYKGTSSTFDICLVILGIIYKITIRTLNIDDDNVFEKYIIKNEIIMRSFWKITDIVYLSIIYMTNAIRDDIALCNIQLNSIDDINIKDNIKLKIKQGHKMLKLLNDMLNHMDLKWIDSIIICNFDYVINNKIYEIMSRVINYFSYKKNLKTCKFFPKLILNILDNDTIPVHIKCDCMRIIISHNLKNEIINYTYNTDDKIDDKIDNKNIKIIKKYILNDVDKLYKISKLHFVDIMLYYHDTTVMDDEYIIELYLNMLPEFVEQYILLSKSFIDTDNENKIFIINDITNMIDMSEHLINNIHKIKYATSYIENIILYLHTIMNTKKYFDDKDLHLLNNFKNKFNTRICPLFVNAIEKIYNNCDKYKIIIDEISYNILKNDFNLDTNFFEKYIKANNDLVLSSEINNKITDNITCDIIRNPYFIPKSHNYTNINNDIILVDRKTAFNIGRKKENPYTREFIDLDFIEEFNTRIDIIDKISTINKYLEQI